MINLLPEDYKKELHAARMNVVLLRYNVITIAAIAFLALSCGVFYVMLSENKTAAEKSNQENVAKASGFNDTKTQADEYRNNLSIAKKILANEVDYTDLIFGITALLPQGVVLDNVNLTAADFGNQTVFSAHAKNYDDVAKLKQSFENSSLFAKNSVFFQTINESTTSNSDYPISVSISVKINKVKN